MRNGSIILLLLVFLLLGSCKEHTQSSASKPIEITFTKEGSLEIKRAADDSLVAVLDVEFAESEYEVQRGLMDRYSMAKDQGMLFVFQDVRPRSFYMKNTYIPLDIIFIDADLRIINIAKNTQPADESSIFSEGPAKYVLEVVAGLTDELQLQTGDRISYQRQ